MKAVSIGIVRVEMTLQEAKDITDRYKHREGVELSPYPGERAFGRFLKVVNEALKQSEEA